MDEGRVKGLHRVEVRDRNGDVDEAVLEIRYRRIKILPPIGKQKRYPSLTLTVIRAEERGEPKNRDKIEWKLITDLAVQSRNDAIEKVNWYAMRWKTRLSEAAGPTRVASLAAVRIMIPVPMGTQIWVACGATDMRRYALHTNMLSLRRHGEYLRRSSILQLERCHYSAEHNFGFSLGATIASRGHRHARTRREVALHGSRISAGVCG
jgi:hypothetical protein